MSDTADTPLTRQDKCVCGRLVAPDWAHCPDCGLRLADEVQATETVEAAVSDALDDVGSGTPFQRSVLDAAEVHDVPDRHLATVFDRVFREVSRDE